MSYKGYKDVEARKAYLRKKNREYRARRKKEQELLNKKYKKLLDSKALDNLLSTQTHTEVAATPLTGDQYITTPPKTAKQHNSRDHDQAQTGASYKTSNLVWTVNGNVK